MLDIKSHGEFYQTSCVVRIARGLHARPAMCLVNLFQDYANDVLVAKEIDGELGEYIDGRSVIGLMTLETFNGEKLHFFFNRQPKEVKIEQVREILVGLEKLMNDKSA